MKLRLITLFIVCIFDIQRLTNPMICNEIHHKFCCFCATCTMLYTVVTTLHVVGLVGPKNLLLSNLEFRLSLKSVDTQLKISSLPATEVECRYQQNVSFLY